MPFNQPNCQCPACIANRGEPSGYSVGGVYLCEGQPQESHIQANRCDCDLCESQRRELGYAVTDVPPEVWERRISRYLQPATSSPAMSFTSSQSIQDAYNNLFCGTSVTHKPSKPRVKPLKDKATFKEIDGGLEIDIELTFNIRPNDL